MEEQMLFSPSLPSWTTVVCNVQSKKFLLNHSHVPLRFHHEYQHFNSIKYTDPFIHILAQSLKMLRLIIIVLL